VVLLLECAVEVLLGYSDIARVCNGATRFWRYFLNFCKGAATCVANAPIHLRISAAVHPCCAGDCWYRGLLWMRAAAFHFYPFLLIDKVSLRE
jgi:hypothetical protein